MYYRLIAIAAAAVALQGCATPQVQTVSGENINEGIAKSCTPSVVDLASGLNANATITQSNDGWCGINVTERDGQPFQLGLVRTRPAHGRVFIQKIGGKTRIEYSADGRYTGPDQFKVELQARSGQAGNATVQVAVNVTMGEGMAPTPAAAPAAAAPAARTPARTPARPATPARGGR